MEAIKAAVSVDEEFEYFDNNMYKAAATSASWFNSIIKLRSSW